MKEFVIVLALLLLAIILLCVRILLVKNGRFSSHDVGQSRAMQQRGIGCTRSQDRQARRANPKRIDVNNL